MVHQSSAAEKWEPTWFQNPGDFRVGVAQAETLNGWDGVENVAHGPKTDDEDPGQRAIVPRSCE